MSVYRISLWDQGNVTISVDVDLFELSARQRDLVFGLIDDVKALAVTHAADGGGALVADIAAALDPAATVAHVPPSTAPSPAGDKQRRRAYTSAEKQAAVLAAKRDGPTKACRDLGISSVSVLRKWMNQLEASGGSIPPTWLRLGKSGPATNDDIAVARAARARGAESVARIHEEDRTSDAIADALERERVGVRTDADIDALEREGLPSFPDAGPIERLPVSESRARESAAAAAFDDGF